MRSATPRRRRAMWIGATVLGALVAAAAAATLVVFERTTPVAGDGERRAVLAAGDVSASFVPPSGWEYRRAPWSDAEMELSSPDRAVTVEVSARERAAEDAAAPEWATGAPAVEMLASGLTVIHADTIEGLVAEVSDAETLVRFVVEAGRAGVDLAPYRPSIAALLDSVTTP